MPAVKEMLKKKRDKHQVIIDSAIKIFAKKGFHNTKISEIAKMAKIGEGTLYLYFKSKEELLIKCFEEMLVSLLSKIQKEVESVDDKLLRLHRFIEVHIEFLQSHPSQARLLMIELRQSPEFYKKYPAFWPVKQYLNFLSNLCSDAIEAGVIRKVDPEMLTSMIFGTMDFVLTRWLLNDYEMDLITIKSSLEDILANGIKNINGV